MRAGFSLAVFYSSLQILTFLLRRNDNFVSNGTRLLVLPYVVLGPLAGALVEKHKSWIRYMPRAAFVGFLVSVPLGAGRYPLWHDVPRTRAKAIATVLLFSATFGAASGAGLYRSLTATRRVGG